MIDSKEIIYPEDSRAAEYRTGISGWVSRSGRFYGDQQSAARDDGCTNWHCENCNGPSRKFHVRCDPCREKKQEADARQKYDAMPTKKWDGVAMIYSNVLNQYFNDTESAEDACPEGQPLEDLQLIICEPDYPNAIDLDDFMVEMPEGADAPDELVAAIDIFNASAKGIVMSWSPGKFAVDLS